LPSTYGSAWREAARFVFESSFESHSTFSSASGFGCR
jgi:hypothetical protein